MSERDDRRRSLEVPRPPTEDELPCDDGEPMETARHRWQMNLLIEPLFLGYWADRDDVYVGGNSFLYFSEAQTKKNEFRGPDVFVVLDTVRRSRKSWVMWGEGGRLPHVIIELTSESTWREDHGEKRRVYEGLRIPIYVIYDPYSEDLDVLRFDPETRRYRPLEVVDQRVHLSELGLDLAVWHGVHADEHAPWLRWHLSGGPPLPTGIERGAEAERVARRVAAEAERTAAEAQRTTAEAQRAATEAQRAVAEAERAAAAEKGRADALAARLAELERRSRDD